MSLKPSFPSFAAPLSVRDRHHTNSLIKITTIRIVIFLRWKLKRKCSFLSSQKTVGRGLYRSPLSLPLCSIAAGSRPVTSILGGKSMRVYARQPVNLTQVRIPRGQVFLIPDRCKGCQMCVEFCPQQVLRMSTAMNARGYHYPEIAPGKENACVHCEFCMMVCPEFAIFTLEVDSA